VVRALAGKSCELSHEKGIIKPTDSIAISTQSGGADCSSFRLIAILLGRLRLSVRDAIDQYAKLAKVVFSDKKMSGNIFQGGTFKASKLESEIKSVLENKIGKGGGESMMFEKTGCKTQVHASHLFLFLTMSNERLRFLCAMPMKHVDGDPSLFRTWEAVKNPGEDCRIWEACRATSAAPRFFKSISIGQTTVEEKYVDGAFGCNNPTEVLIKEAALEFSPTTKISCIVSIGTGQPKVSQIDTSSPYQRAFPRDLIRVLKDYATSSERVAKRLEERFAEFFGLFHRLNVERGLEEVSLDEWDKLGDVKTHTGKYLKRKEVNQSIETIVAALLDEPEKIYQLCQLGI